MRIIGVAIIGALLIGCSDSTAPAVIEGTYPLRSYRYEPLPGAVSETTDHAVQITGGSITLNGDLTFHSSYGFRTYDYGTVRTVVTECSGHWEPTKISPQGGQLITLTQASTPGCGDGATAEWDHHNRLTIVWLRLGDTQHAR